MNSHNTKYTHGDVVYLRTDPDQLPRMVTSISIYPSGVTYNLSHCVANSDHYEMEITSEPNQSVKLGISE